MYGASVRLVARIFVTDLARSTEWFQDLLGSEPTAGAAPSGYVVFDIGADLVLTPTRPIPLTVA
jgi:hypothetical protein